jgi:MHS family proline/betaine transporter-like MFS transporter
VARIKLRETPEFVNHQHRLKCKTESSKQYSEIYKAIEYKKNIDIKTMLGLFCTTFFISVSFYITYIYLGDFAKNVWGMSPEQVISHNFKISICTVFASGMIAYLCKKHHPVNNSKNKYVYICYCFIIYTILAL